MIENVSGNYIPRKIRNLSCIGPGVGCKKYYLVAFILQNLIWRLAPTKLMKMTQNEESM